MIGNITPQMPEKLVAYLRPGAPGLLLTSGADGYATSAFTWIIALDGQRARFAVDEGGSTMANLERGGQALHRRAEVGRDGDGHLAGTRRHREEAGRQHEYRESQRVGCPRHVAQPVFSRARRGSRSTP